MLSVLKEQEPELNEVNENLSLLMEQVDEKTPHATQVRGEVSQADQKQKDLIEKLNARKVNLEEDVKHARVFQGSLADLEAWLPEAEERVSAQQPISTDPETVRKQLEDAQVGSNVNDLLLFLFCSLGEEETRQGSYGSWKTWKVLEFYYAIFQDWKVLEKGQKSWKFVKLG